MPRRKSKKPLFTKGQECGKEDNCKSKLYYYEENGFKYCKNGHMQEVNVLCSVPNLGHILLISAHFGIQAS